MKYLKFVLPALILLFLTPNFVLADDVIYNDLSSAHWAYNAVQTLAQKGIIQGYPDGSFKPDRKVTREQFAIILVKTLNIPLKDESWATQIFWDISEDHRSFLYIDAAKPFIPVPDSNGYAFNFYPDRPITREEAAQAIVLALGLHKAQKPNSNYLASKFSDYQNIAPGFKENVAIAAYYGILSGNSKGEYAPKSQLSRGELCVIMSILLRNDSNFQDGFKLPRKPWTIDFIIGGRSDREMVRNFPDYNKTQSFYGKVSEKVLGFNNSHLVVKFPYEDDSSAKKTIKEMVVNVYVSDKDLNLFNKGDWVTFYFDRNNNITSYVLNNKVYNITKGK